MTALLKNQGMGAIAIGLSGILLLAGCNLKGETVADSIDSKVDDAIALEAKTNLEAMTRGQQAAYLAGEFAPTLDGLALGIPSETSQYRFEVAEADAEKSVMTATAVQEGLQSYTAAVYALNGQLVTMICESNEPTTTPPAAPVPEGAALSCADGSTAVE